MPVVRVKSADIETDRGKLDELHRPGTASAFPKRGWSVRRISASRGGHRPRSRLHPSHTSSAIAAGVGSLVACLLLAFSGAAADAQSVNAVGIGLPQVATNAALQNLTGPFSSVMRLGFYAAGDSPAVLYTKSASACPLNGGAGDNGWQVRAADDKCWLMKITPTNTSNDPQPTGYDVRIWGAKCNWNAGDSDDQVPIQNAINFAEAQDGAGAIIRIPDSTCYVRGTQSTPLGATSLYIQRSNVVIDGGAAGSLRFDNGAADGIQIAGTYPRNWCPGCNGGNGSGASGIAGVFLKNLFLGGIKKTGGNIVWQYNCGCEYDNVNIAAESWNGMKIQASVQTNIHGGSIATSVAGGNGRYMLCYCSAGDGTEVSNGLTIFQMVINAGGHTECFVEDGWSSTVQAYSLELIACGGAAGLHVKNTAASASHYPIFAAFYDLEIDNGTGQAIQLDAGEHFLFANAQLNARAATTGGTSIFAVTAGSGGQQPNDIQIVGSELYSGPGVGLTFNGKSLQVTSSSFWNIGYTASNSYPAIDIGANAADVQIANSQIGYGGFQRKKYSKYGIQIESGAKRVTLISNNYYGNLTEALNDLSRAVTNYGGYDQSGIPMPFIQNGTSSVNCSGSPSRGFQTVNGIVTHC